LYVGLSFHLSPLSSCVVHISFIRYPSRVQHLFPFPGRPFSDTTDSRNVDLFRFQNFRPYNFVVQASSSCLARAGYFSSSVMCSAKIRHQSCLKYTGEKCVRVGLRVEMQWFGGKGRNGEGRCLQSFFNLSSFDIRVSTPCSIVSSHSCTFDLPMSTNNSLFNSLAC